MSSFDLDAWRSTWTEGLDHLLRSRVSDTWPVAFREALEYPLFGGGKRVRPALCVAAYRATCVGEGVGPAMPAAVAVELIHSYSLVHDDLPAMDDDDERRGRPTVHVAFDEATAILVGDTLLTEAFAVLAEALWPPSIRVALVRSLARAAGHRGMVGGQVADIRLGSKVDSVETLSRLHELKTGALIHWAVTAGGRVAGTDEETLSRLSDYGRKIGLAFQLADDILDAHEAEDREGPPSYVRLLGIDETRRRAHELVESAIDAVRPLHQPDALIAIARFTVARNH